MAHRSLAGPPLGQPGPHRVRPGGKCIKEVRAVQRMPLAGRWGREALQAVDAWPRRLEPAQEGGEARVVPEAVPQPGAPPPAERRGPYPVYIYKSDLATYGYSDGVCQVRPSSGRKAGFGLPPLGRLPPPH